MAFKDRIKELRRVPAGELRPHAANYRVHPDNQRTALREVLEKIGIADACAAYEEPDGGLRLIDGHLRAGLDPEQELPVLVLDVTPEEAEQLLAVFDPLTGMAEADAGVLKSLVLSLEGHVQAGLIAALDSLPSVLDSLNVEWDPHADEIHEGPPEEFETEGVPQRVEKGDVWQLGTHILACGDSTSVPDVARLMSHSEGVLAVTITDPPYNVGLDYASTDDKKSAEAFADFSFLWFTLAREHTQRVVLTPGMVNLRYWAAMEGYYHMAPILRRNVMKYGFISTFLCWEPLVFFGTGWPRKRGQDLFDFPVSVQEGTGDHPCPKQLALFVDLVENYTELGEAVYEPFCGSGTTLMACEATERRCVAMEHDPHYCDLTLARWQSYTGKQPVLLERKQ